MQKYNILELNEKLLPELQTIAEELGIKKVRSFKKEELVYKILDEQAISYAGIQAEKEKVKEAAIRLFTTRFLLGMFDETEFDKIPKDGLRRLQK